MSDVAIKIENLSKLYRLGIVSTGTLSHDLNRFWTTKIRGKEDPFLRIGETNDRTRSGKSEYVLALKDINLEIRQGERIGIIGKNGAGKSTLLKILSQVTGPSKGKIKMKGRTGSLLEVGTGFHQELTGRENIYMNGTILGMSHKEVSKKLDEIVDFAGVERYLDTPVKRYSSGMMVRLGFAVAAHLEPDILVVDEVLAVGDAEFQKKAIGKMQEVSEGHGRTILFVSHNMASINQLCDKCILFDKGSIVEEGATQGVVDNYLRGGYAHTLHFATWGEEVQPSSKFLRLTSAIIEQDANPFGDHDFAISKPINIKFTYKVIKKCKGLFSTILLRYGNHIDVLATINGHKSNLVRDKFFNAPLDAGMYEATCTIPSNFLNEGLYSVSIVIGEYPSETLIFKEDIMSFMVCETGEMRDKFNGGWVGVVRPKLAWQTTKL